MVKVIDAQSLDYVEPILPKPEPSKLMKSSGLHFFSQFAKMEEALPSCIEQVIPKTKLKKRSVPPHRTRSTQTGKKGDLNESKNQSLEIRIENRIESTGKVNQCEVSEKENSIECPETENQIEGVPIQKLTKGMQTD